jgi:hypothetical protein
MTPTFREGRVHACTPKAGRLTSPSDFAPLKLPDQTREGKRQDTHLPRGKRQDTPLPRGAGSCLHPERRVSDFAPLCLHPERGV